MEQRRHLWNGKWGRLARRDIYVHVDGGRWRVEDVRGGAEGKRETFDFDGEDAALERFRDLTAGGDGWTDLTERPGT